MMPAALIMAIIASVLNRPAPSKRETKSLRVQRDPDHDSANISTDRILGIVFVVIGAVLVLSVLASLTSTFFASLADINDNLSNASTTTGDPTADDLLPTFVTLIAIIGLLAFIGMAIGAIRMRRG